MRIFRKIVFPLFIFFLLNISSNQAISQTQDSTKAQQAQAGDKDPVNPKTTLPDSTQQKSWIEQNPTFFGFIGVLVGVAATLLLGFGLQTKKKVAQRKRAEIQAERKEKAEIEIQARDDIEYRYLRGLEKEHGKLTCTAFSQRQTSK